MSRRVPALAMLAVLAVVPASVRGEGVVVPTAARTPEASVVPSVGSDVANPTTMPESAAVAVRNDSTQDVDSIETLVFPLQDSIGVDSAFPGLFRDMLVQGLGKDTMPHGRVEGWLGGVPSSASEAESLGRGARTIVWLRVVADDSGRRILLARRILRSTDSVLTSIDLPYPDSAEQALTSLPGEVIVGLFPRKRAALPPPVALTDSVKRVAVLLFLAEGTALPAHATLFTDTLSRRIEGMDGFKVLPSRLRDSLLSGWDPGECLTASCRREVGERLGVPWIIAGHISQLGDKWSVRAELVRVDSASGARNAVVQCQGAPMPSLKLASGMTARQLAGKEKPRKELTDAPVARDSQGPAWARILALAIATTMGAIGVAMSW